MSLGKAQKHMQRAAELLNQGELEFGRAQRKTKTKPKKTKKKPESPLQKEGITCYADSNILEMLGLNSTDIHTFEMNLEPLQNGKDHLFAHSSSLRTISHKTVEKDYILVCVKTANLILVTHDNYETQDGARIGSIRGFALCRVFPDLMVLDFIGSSEKQIMQFRNSKMQIGGMQILNEVIRLGSKMKKGIELFAIAEAILLYHRKGFRFKRSCSDPITRDHTDHLKRLSEYLKKNLWCAFEDAKEVVKPFAVYGKDYYKTLSRSGPEKAEEEAFDAGYRMILCPEKS